MSGPQKRGTKEKSDSGYATSEVSAWFRRQIASRVVVRPQPGAGLSSVCQGGRSRIGHGSTYRE